MSQNTNNAVLKTKCILTYALRSRKNFQKKNEKKSRRKAESKTHKREKRDNEKNLGYFQG